MDVRFIPYLVNLAPNRHQFRVLTQSFGTKSQTVDNQIETVNVFETVDGFLNDFSAQVFKSVEQIFEKSLNECKQIDKFYFLLSHGKW